MLHPRLLCVEDADHPGVEIVFDPTLSGSVSPESASSCYNMTAVDMNQYSHDSPPVAESPWGRGYITRRHEQVGCILLTS